MTPRTTSLIAVSAALFAGTPASQAALTFVDADFSTNTTGQATPITEVEAANDLWRSRPSFGTNGIFEADGNAGAEDAPELVTQIAGLNPGQTYRVWVNFYDVDNDANQNWGIQAGFSSGSLTAFSDSDGPGGPNPIPGSVDSVLASSFSYEGTAPSFDDGGGRLLNAGYLGTAVAVGGEISVFIDDLDTGVTSNNRAWYDGVSYEVVPEPTVALLGGLGLLGLLRRRR